MPPPGQVLAISSASSRFFDLDDRKAADDFLGLDERAVRDDSLAVLDANGGGAARTLEFGATGDPARPAVLLEPLVYPLVASGSCGLGHLLPGFLLIDATGKH